MVVRSILEEFLYLKSKLPKGVRRVRVRFFGKIPNRIVDVRSHGYFAPKVTKNPKMDYFAMTTP